MVTDAVLGLQGEEPFPKRCFKKIGWPNPLTVNLHNVDETLAVDCSVDGVVLTANLKELGWSREKAKAGFLRLAEVIKLYKGNKTVNRIGCLTNYIAVQGRAGWLMSGFCCSRLWEEDGLCGGGNRRVEH
jgi:hypothetical protein